MGYSGRYQSVEESNYSSEKIGGIQGFYYDNQLEDPFLSMTLHANTKQKSDGSWDWWGSGEKECLQPVDAKGAEAGKHYGKDPLARCIFSEDFSYSIMNDFTDANMGNPIEGLFNNVKHWAPMMGKLSEGLSMGIKDVDKNSGFASSWVNTINNSLKDWKIPERINALSRYLNKALFVQGSRFTYYNGTQFNFNNLEMKFIAFSDYVKEGGSWVFQSVEDYIKKLQPYVMGKYTPGASNAIREVTGINIEKGSNAEQFLDTYVGFQSPPGGFYMDTVNLNNVLKGTLRLDIGGTWAIENLVLKNMNISMSKVQAKHPEKEGETVPLYAEIVLQLVPAAMIIDTNLGKILNHNGMSKIRGALHKNYGTKLKELKNNYTK